MYLAVDGKPAGLLSVTDPIKKSTASIIERLRRENLNIVMVTGDNLATAKAVAKKLDIVDVRAEVLPEAEGPES